MWKKSNKGEVKVDNLFQAINAKEERNVKKFNIKEKKNNTLQSLLEVEHFLCQTKRAINSVKLYKILK